MDDKERQERNNTAAEGATQDHQAKEISAAKERLKSFVKKKLRSVHQEVIAPPGQ